MSLDPEVQQFLSLLQQSPSPPLWESSLSEIRDRVLPVPGAPEPVAAVRDEEIPTDEGPLRLRTYEPLDAHMIGTLVYFHGGGWVTGSLDTHDALCRRLCNAGHVRVVATDYRLAPEQKFPAAVNDAFSATGWASEQFRHQPLALAGDSAGGNLAAAVALLAKDHPTIKIAAQVLVYPIVDINDQTPSYNTFAEGYFLTRPMMQWFFRQYLNSMEDANDPRVSVLRAEDVTRLPATLIISSEYDVLRDEGLAYADRLEESGVPVERIMCRGMIHGFLRRLDTFTRAGEVCLDIGNYLRRTLES